MAKDDESQLNGTQYSDVILQWITKQDPWLELFKADTETGWDT